MAPYKNWKLKTFSEIGMVKLFTFSNFLAIDNPTRPINWLIGN
jgi:hypothetical protein